MLIGVPREIKVREYRVGLTPAGVRELVQAGHKVLVETNAGASIDFDDDTYRAAGADIAASAEDVFAKAEMIVKVKEPQPNECKMLREGQIIFTYLHLAPDPTQTKLLVESGAIAIAYETVTDPRGRLPLLAPMSEVAGRLSVQAGARCLEAPMGGRGMLLGGVPGVPQARVAVIGGGVVGINAARLAMGAGARVTVLDKSLERLAELDNLYGPALETLYSTADSIEEKALEADLLIGAVLVPGAAAPKLVTREMLAKMKRRAVVVDVAIDQGGCFETSHPTTHDEPVFEEENIVHYCVANMPGAVPLTSTLALTNATLPFVRALADKGYKQALADDPHLLEGLNVHHGQVTYEAVAEALDYDHVPAREALDL
jgi:alanine dehydrogenase